MKKFVIKVFCFLLIMFILDRGFGFAMNFLKEHAKGGYVGHHNHIIKETSEEILVFGSSRAIHHYNPRILQDTLGMSCYNCGQDGNGIILFYGWWQLMRERHLPQYVIYDVNPEFDLLKGDNIKYLGWLRSEYDNDSIKSIFDEIDFTEKYKMQSMMYRYNSKFLQFITDYLHPVYQISEDGFLPMVGEMDKMKLKEPVMDIIFDNVKIQYLKRLSKDVTKAGCKLVFVASPIWYGKDEICFEPLKEICKEYDIPFYNYSKDSIFVKNDSMFRDGNHLNEKGADVFTSILAHQLQSVINR